MKTAYVARLACHAGIACVVAVTFLLLGGSVNLSRTAYADGGALTAGTAGSNAAGASQAGGYTEVAKVTLNKTSGLIKNNGKLNLKATSFVIGSNVPKKTAKYDSKVWWNRYLGRDAIKKVRSEYPNLEFQSHTYNMHYRSGGVGIAKFLSRKKIDADFAKNEKFGFTCIAYPFGHTSKNLLASVKANKSMRLGFGYMMNYPASRTSPIYNVPRFKVFGDRGLGDFKRIVRTAS